MPYNAYVAELKNVRPHPNADRMKLADCFGNTICVGLDAKENDRVVYFPCDGQLSEEYCAQNNLVRKKDENGNNIGGYLDPDKRNVTAIRLRGEKSDGLTMPLSSVGYTGIDINELKIGDSFTALNGHEICQKYIPRKRECSVMPNSGNRVRKKKAPIAPLFIEHADTEQLAYNFDAFKLDDDVEITLKMHGTSQRTGYLPVFNGYTTKGDVMFYGGKLSYKINEYILNHWKDAKSKFKQRQYEKAINNAIPTYDWSYVTGTRRTVLDNYDGGFYGSNAFREQHSKIFEGKLHKGEEVYYEVVGFTHTGQPIMAQASNKKLNDKNFVKQYGETTTFSYGCEPPESDIYVYRMTMTNEDGDIVEYTPEFMRYRCEQMGVKPVPALWRGRIPHIENNFVPGEWIRDLAEKYYDGSDPIGKTHVREGVVCRIVNRPKFCAYKHKNFSFKVLEGIAKADTEAPDMEEAQEIILECTIK